MGIQGYDITSSTNIPGSQCITSTKAIIARLFLFCILSKYLMQEIAFKWNLQAKAQTFT